MSYGLPSRGQADWDDELNNSIENLRGKADAAAADASNAVSTANSATNLALAADARSRKAASSVVGDVLGEPFGAAELDSTGRLPEGQVPDRLTEASLNATTVTRAAQIAHAPGLGLFFVEAEGGGPGATAAANTAAFEAARLAAAAARPGGGVVTDADGHPTITQGGGKVWLQAGATYDVDGVITLDPRTKIIGYGATIVATAAAAGFYAPPSTVAGSFMSDYPALEGVTFDGANVATHGLRLEATAHAAIRDVLVLRCASHNIRLTGAQWTDFSNVSSQSAGGYDWYLEPYDPGATRLPASNNNRFVDCFAQRGTLGGVYIDGGQGNDWFGFTSQFHATTAGVTIAGGAIGMNFVGGHYEENAYHFDIVEATSTRIITPYFNSNPDVIRFVRNGALGRDTVVVAPSCNRSALSAGGAHFERNSGGGELRVIHPPRVSGVNSFVDETGAVTDPSTGRLPAPASLNVVENDYRQNNATLYGTHTHSGADGSSISSKWKRDAETDYRLTISADGVLTWGPGDGTSDAYLQRASAGVLGVLGNVRPVGSTQTLGVSALGWQKVFLGSSGVQVTQGTGSPEGVVFAQAGSLFLRSDGGAGTTLYVKESGSAATNTGWVAK